MNKIELNNQQLKAVKHDSGPALVVAGAGTGKTKVIIERIAKLIDSGVDPAEILALTFTEKAAAEMQDRLAEARGNLSLDTTIQTYNGFGSDVLRKYAVDLGLSSNLRLLGEVGKLVFLREHLDKFELEYFSPISAPESQLKYLAECVSILKQQLINPKKYLEKVSKLSAVDDAEKIENSKQVEIANFYKTYIEVCKNQSVIDYDDQIYLTVELFERRPNVLKDLQTKFKYILVDEFQDTNPMQSKMLDLLSAEHKNLMVVGDDDQSIYGWRGATLKNILSFKDRYTDASEITLVQNYRNTQPILDSAYELIQNNNPNRLEAMHSLDKKLKSISDLNAKPNISEYSSLDAELNSVAEKVQGLLDDKVEPSEIAILARRNQIVLKVHETLSNHGIDHQVAGLSNSIYQQFSTKILLDGLRAIVDPQDGVSLFHTLSSPLFSITTSLLSESSALAKRESETLENQLLMLDDKKISSSIDLISNLRQKSNSLSVSELTYMLITESGWKEKLYKEAEDDELVAREVQILGQFFSTLQEFERISSSPTVQNYIDSLETLLSDDIEVEDDTLSLNQNLVSVSTIHKSKGLEWEHVFVVDVSEGSMPMRNFGRKFTPIGQETENPADEHLAEERRMMYVAMTRAKSDLNISYSQTHNYKSKRKDSRFIDEISKLSDKKSLTEELDEKQQIELISTNANSGVVIPSSMIDKDNYVLNVTQISTYLRCPQDFYWRHILRVPSEKQASAEYGTLLHGLIQTIHEKNRAKSKINKQELIDAYVEKIPNKGYVSADHKFKAIANAEKVIKEVIDRFTQEPVPDRIEDKFRVKLASSNLIITGRMDAVYETDGIEIRDYKSGSTAIDADSAKKRAQRSNQLSLYALAWKTMYSEMPSKLVLDFVETNQIGEVKKRESTIDKLEATLSELPDAIRSLEFPPASDHTFCKHPTD